MLVTLLKRDKSGCVSIISRSVKHSPVSSSGTSSFGKGQFGAFAKYASSSGEEAPTGAQAGESAACNKRRAAKRRSRPRYRFVRLLRYLVRVDRASLLFSLRSARFSGSALPMYCADTVTVRRSR